MVGPGRMGGSISRRLMRAGQGADVAAGLARAGDAAKA